VAWSVGNGIPNFLAWYRTDFMFRRKTTDARATDAPALASCTRRSHSSLVQSDMSVNLLLSKSNFPNAGFPEKFPRCRGANLPGRRGSGESIQYSGFVAGFSGERISLPKFPFGLKPEFFIPSRWPAILFPDFPGAFSDSPLVGSRQVAGAVFQFFRQHHDALSRFPIANPPREIAVLAGLCKQAPDDLFPIHLRSPSR
jgi:hypothetical protein